MTEHAEFVKFGTSLPDFKGEDEQGERSLSVRTKFNEPHQFKHDVRIADQVVTDAQGRRRFHGAFTGGYSAGYYNSVGSEQGWTPKNNLERKLGQTTDDFMDDEDKEEFGISPRGLAIKEAFKPGVSQKARPGFPGMGVPGSSLPKKVSGYAHNLIPKTECTMGLRILRTMGFVEGNSTNLAHVDKMLAIQRKLILAKQKNDVQKSLELLEEKLRIRGKVTSKTTEFVLPKSNNQNFGMGYKKLNQLYKKNTESSAVVSTKSKFAISGGGFGVNCFEEEDDDVYAMDSMKNYDIDINIASARKPDRSDTDYSLMALGYNDNVLFKKSKHCKTFERLHQQIPRPDVPRNWRPKIAVFQRKIDPEEEAKKRHQIRTISERSNILKTDEDHVEDKRKNLMNQQVEWERQREVEVEKKKEEEKKVQEANKKKLLESVFAGRFTHERGDDERAETKEIMEELNKKVANIVITTWAPANKLCMRFNVPNPRVVDSSEKEKLEKVVDLFEGNDKLELKQNRNAHFGSVLPTPGEMKIQFEEKKNINKDAIRDSEQNDEERVNNFLDEIEEENNLEKVENVLEKRPEMDVFASIFGDEDDDDEDNVDLVSEDKKLNELLPEDLRTVSGPAKTKFEKRGNMERFEDDTHDTSRHDRVNDKSEKHIVGVPGKNLVNNILNKYKQQMKFNDIDDEKNWWKERPVQRRPTNIYREKDSDDELMITGANDKGINKITNTKAGKVKLVDGAVKGYANMEKEVKKKKVKKEKKSKKEQKSKKKKSKKDDSDSSDWEEAFTGHTYGLPIDKYKAK